jgi:hypothetical protein
MVRQKTISVLVAALAILTTTAGSAAQIVVPDDFDTISAAIIEASENDDSSDIIIVEPGTYRVNLSLIDNLVLQGRETSRTFLVDGSDDGSNGAVAAITANGVNNVRVSNFTFRNGETAISIQASSNVTVSNNVFRLRSDGTAFSAETSLVVMVENNTFIGNGTALMRDSDQTVVRNNIFADNTTAISSDNLDANIFFNGFFGNTNDGPQGTDAVTNGDAEFVDTVLEDFHLLEGSPAIDAGFGTDIIDGTTADLGAFGGVNADHLPFPVQNVAVAATSDTSVTLTWDRNLAYLVSGYRVYYGPQSSDYSGTDAAEGSSPISVGDVDSFILTGLAGATAPSAPNNLTANPANGTLQLNWSPVAGAGGYRVRYGVASTAENQIDVGNVTTFDLTGLTNGTPYRVTVSALSQTNRFFAVSARDSTTAQNESALIDEVQARLGEVLESPPSNEATEFPETLVAHPRLPDEGCFIATAAFGYYDAPEVQALRDVRDRYLLTHASGRLFVDWYYSNSPAAAHWLNQHPGLKPVVRGLLLPSVKISMVVTGRSSPWPLLMLMLGYLVAWHWRSLQRARRVACL